MRGQRALRAAVRPRRGVLAQNFHDYVRTRSDKGMTARIPLRAGVTYGSAQGRGDRARQEDALSVACVSLPCDELRQTLTTHISRREKREPWHGWTCDDAGGPDLAAQVVWFGCFDGHGGGSVAKVLQTKLHEVFESADPSMITDTVRYTRSLGGYFGRFNGGALERWVNKDVLQHATPPRKKKAAPATLEELAQQGGDESDLELEHYVALDRDRGEHHTHTEHIAPPPSLASTSMTLEERATLACLMMDREIQQHEEHYGAGSTASVLLLHSLDEPFAPWYESQHLALTTVHLGDTRFLLCPVRDGVPIRLTPEHHPDDTAEAERLSRLGAGIITDSFGETRVMGAFANSRAFGDSAAKRFGVTAEPDVRTLLLDASHFAFAIGVSDGITCVMSDQEIVDECRGAQHPQEAAERVLRYAEALGSDDNASVVCVPLTGWGRVGGADRTEDLRRERRKDVDMFRSRRT